VLGEVEELLGGGNRLLGAIYLWGTSKRGSRGRTTTSAGVEHRGGRAGGRCEQRRYKRGVTRGEVA